ncbi:hypothetical protein M404DRAFT_899209 [Pisolithus tinctorius Marx 270]|uniref:Uncharacterized protein n=1 Tax=Pisolithus tinctorius Marx 270 TaxID=870435 RepID=A0A0C3KKU5_PISTI|nr:hypothetical protein M404DRAFT_899209 [Pisolithus tinctorius Marx 270]
MEFRYTRSLCKPSSTWVAGHKGITITVTSHRFSSAVPGPLRRLRGLLIIQCWANEAPTIGHT